MNTLHEIASLVRPGWDVEDYHFIWIVHGVTTHLFYKSTLEVRRAIQIARGRISQHFECPMPRKEKEIALSAGELIDILAAVKTGSTINLLDPPFTAVAARAGATSLRQTSRVDLDLTRVLYGISREVRSYCELS